MITPKVMTLWASPETATAVKLFCLLLLIKKGEKKTDWCFIVLETNLKKGCPSIKFTLRWFFKSIKVWKTNKKYKITRKRRQKEKEKKRKKKENEKKVKEVKTMKVEQEKKKKKNRKERRKKKISKKKKKKKKKEKKELWWILLK